MFFLCFLTVLSSLGLCAAPLKILNVGNGSDPQDIDPQLVTGLTESRLILSLLEGLVIQDPQGKVAPGVAERWEISPDGLVYTFHLRADARWSDGTAVTARDFLRSYQRLLSPALGAEDAYFLYPVVGAADYHAGTITDFARTGFKVIDDRTLQITLRQRTYYFLSVLTFPQCGPVPMHVIEKLGAGDRRGNAWSRAENFVGNGAFTLKSWKSGQKLSVVRSATYWDRANVKLDGIDFYAVDSNDTEERMFRTGQLHLTYTLPVSKIANYERASNPALRIDPFAGLYFYVFNVKRAPFDDVRVRRALSLAIDRELLIKRVFQAGQTAAYQTVPPGLDGYHSHAMFKADVGEARRLLAEAGYPDGKKFPVSELLFNTSENHRLVAEAIQQMWRKNLGVEITLTNQEWKVYLDATKTHHFQIARAGWSSTNPHAHLEIWETGNPNNLADWGNPDYDRLLREALAAPTDETREALYVKMEQLLADEMPIIPISFVTFARLVSPKVLGFRTALNDLFPWKYVDLAP